MFLRGASITLLVAIVGTIIGSLIGLLIGVVRTIPMPESRVKGYLLKCIHAIIATYIEVFRGTPMIVQAVVIYYGSAKAFNFNVDVLHAAFFIVSINTGAYMAEIVRGGIVSIEKGQFEAAQAIGMTHLQTMIHVILPQAIRNILPAAGNEFVINIKDSSVLNVITLNELFFQTKSVTGNTFQYFETYFIASVIYLIMTISITRILRLVERKLDGADNYSLMANQMQVQTSEDILKKKEREELEQKTRNR
jgi:putative lysine transport system permease protein